MKFDDHKLLDTIQFLFLFFIEMKYFKKINFMKF